MSDIFSPDNISYIASWCTILAFLFGAGYVIRIGVRKTVAHFKNKGDHNSSAQSDSGPINQNGTQYIFQGPTTIKTYPGASAPSASPASTPTGQPDQDEGDRDA
ncbi:MAG TPA: hypothetical protein VFT53_04350 [Candidatus Saccharimonadales bacterium]|nr:hypothetical protein [Candidatus Saccharimonadales bacterium]